MMANLKIDSPESKKDSFPKVILSQKSPIVRFIFIEKKEWKHLSNFIVHIEKIESRPNFRIDLFRIKD